MGYRRFAILYPRADYGINFKNLFWGQVEQRGGEIVGVESYDPDAVDLQTEIKKLVGLHYITPKVQKLITERERLERRRTENEERLADIALMNLPPHIDFDALFIPDVADKVGLILPQLRLYDIQDVKFLGTNDWNDEKLITIAGNDASGVVFTDAFYEGSRDPAVSDFVSRFRSSYGQAPDRFAAQGYDAASMVRTLIDEAGHLSRRQLQRELLLLTNYPGSSGLTSFDEEGGTTRTLRLLTVRRGAFRELDELH